MAAQDGRLVVHGYQDVINGLRQVDKEFATPMIHTVSDTDPPLARERSEAEGDGLPALSVGCDGEGDQSEPSASAA